MSLTHRLRSALSRRASADPARQGPGDRHPRTGARAVSIGGVDPAGAPVSFDLSEGRMVLLFLASSCRPCEQYWTRAPTDGRILVTPSPSTESRRRVSQLARSGQVTVMSSEAWHAYGVRRAPWLVIIEDGLIAVDAPASSGSDPAGT